MNIFTFTLTELMAFGLGLLLAFAISFWRYRQRLSAHQEAGTAQQLLQQELLMQQQQFLQAAHDELDQQLRLSRQVERDQQTQLVTTEKQLAVAQQQLLSAGGLRQKLQERETSYQDLLANYHTLQARSQAEQRSLEAQLKLLNDAKAQLGNEFQLLANKIFDDKQKRFSEQSQTTLDASVGPLKEQIQSFRNKVEDAYDKENAERNKLIGQIAELQKQTRQIGEDAINLTNALKGDNKTQGDWGEIILERLLEESGLQKGREYDVQVALKDEHGRRRNPDVIVRLPEQKDIIIDAKVSLVHYEQYSCAQGEVEREKFLKQHVASMRAHIQQLSAKSYEKLEGVRSLDFIFLFVPIEAAFMVALQADQQLFREAYDRQIILVSPTTLLASLRTVENIWRYEKQNRNAEEIARQAGGLHDQFVLLVEALDDVGKQIGKAGEAYDLVQKRLSTGRGNLIRRVDGLRRLGAKTKKQLSTELLANSEPLPQLKSEEEEALEVIDVCVGVNNS